MDGTERNDDQRVLLGLYGAFYFLNVETEFTAFFTYADLLCQFLFKISFPMTLTVAGSSTFPIAFMGGIRELWTYHADVQVVQITAYVVSFFVVLNWCYLGYLVAFYTRHRTHVRPNADVVQPLNTYLWTTAGPLAIPFISILLAHARCGFQTGSCSGAVVGESVFFFVMALLHSVFVVLYETSVYIWSPFSHLASSKAHHRATAVASLFKCLSAILFSLFGAWSAMSVQYALCIYYLVQSVLVAAIHWYDYPYYAGWMNLVHCFLHATGFMVSLGVLMAMNAGSGDIVAWAVIVVGSILMLPTINSLLAWRISGVNKTEVDLIKHPFEVDIRVRDIMKVMTDSLDMETEAAQQGHFKNINELLASVSKTQRDSLKVNLIWATYTFLYQHNKMYAMNKIRHVLNTSRLAFDVIPLEVRLRMIASDFDPDAENEGLDTYEEQVYLEKISVQSMSKCLSSQLRFWGTLISEDYNYTKLENLTMEINHYMAVSRDSLQRMITLNPKSPFFRKLYSQYLLNIANDDHGAKRQLTRAMELESDEDAKFNLTDSERCIIIMSGERDSLGEIVIANNKTCEKFGVSAEDIMGRKINMLMAKPYSNAHNGKVLNYIEHKTNNLSTMSRVVILKSSNGLAFEGVLQVREFPNFTKAPSVTFFGSIQPMQERSFCVVNIASGIVWEMSSSFSNFFAVEVATIKGLSHHVFEVMPGLKELWDTFPTMLSNQIAYQFAIPHNRSFATVTLQLKVGFLPYLSNDFYVFHIDSEDKLADEEQKRNKMREGARTSAMELLVEKVRSEKAKSKGNKRLVRVKGALEEEEEESASEVSAHELEESEHTQSEVSNSSKGSKSTNLLRLGLSRTNKDMEKQLVYALQSVAGMLLLLCTMSVVLQILWANLTITRYKSSLEMLSFPIRTGTTAGSYSAVMFDHLFYKTLFKSKEEEDREEQRLRREIQDILNKFETFPTAFFEATKAMTEKERKRIIGTRFHLTDYAGDLKEVDPVEAVHMFSTTLNFVLKNDLATLEADKRRLAFLRANLQTDLPAIWNETCLYIVSLQEDSAEQVQQLQLGFMLTAVGLVILSFFAIFIPVAHNVLKKKGEIYQLFENIELGNLRDIVGQCSTKLGELDGAEQFSNNVEVQDMMEVISSKSKNMRAMEDDKNEQQLRQKKKSKINFASVFGSKLMFVFLSLLVVCVAYFVGFYFWWQVQRAMIFDDVDFRVYNSRNRIWYSQKLLLSIINLNHDTQQFEVNLTEAQYWETMLTRTNHALYYGDRSLNILTDIRVRPGGEQMLYGNLCEQFERQGINTFNNTPCETYFDGVLTRGAHELYIAYIGLAVDFRRVYNEQGIAASTDHIRSLKTMADDWLPYVNKILDTYLATGFQSAFKSAESTRSLGTALFVLANIIIGLGIMYPLVRSLNERLQSTRNLLTIIPAEIVDNSPSLRDQIRTIGLRLIQSH
jgi:PAS domain S-box-containing protein